MLWVLLGTSAQAATIYGVTGPSPFGFDNQNPVAIGWSQAIGYRNVSLSIPLADLVAGGPIGGTEGTIYLMNRVGPGTTTANEVATPVPISGLSATFTTHVVFSGLDLPAGNYYVVFVSTQTGSLSNSMEGTSSPIKTMAPGVTEIGWTSGLTPAAYPPATAALGDPPGSANVFMTVTGDPAPASVPALSPAGLIALAAALGLSVFALRRKQA